VTAAGQRRHAGEEAQRAATANWYSRFAAEAARGRAPLYQEFGGAVAGDRETLAFLLTLPEAKRQPNLLFSAVRYLYGTAADWHHFRRTLLANTDAVRAVMLTHSTQTNEPSRCATLLPVLAQLPQPLALIEVGASAGLCLLPDYYGYDYGRATLRPEAPVTEIPTLACSVNEATPLPKTLPRIVWRAGLDLNPVDISDPAQAAWLEALVWPGREDRLATLRAAVKIAAAVKPRLVKGDLRTADLAQLCREAPKDATVVVFHTAVLVYVTDREQRKLFAERAQLLCHYWISNEAPRVFPTDIDGAGRERGEYVLSVNGFPVALSDPHGASLEWIASPGVKPR
jgi:hypothetical protein